MVASVPTPHPKLRIATTSGPLPDIQAMLAWVDQAGAAPAPAGLRAWLRELVPEYTATR